MPMLADIYEGAEDPTFEMFYLDAAEVSFWTFGVHDPKPEIFRL